MASNESEKRSMVSSYPCLVEDDDNFDPYDHDSDEGYHSLENNLSRLSICTSSMCTNEDVDDVGVEVTVQGDFDLTRMFMSRLSIEGFDADDEEQLSDEKEGREDMVLDMITSSDSDKEQYSGCFSLPATPPRRRRSQFGGLMANNELVGYSKEYASDNEAQKGLTRQEKVRKSWGDTGTRKKRAIREGCGGGRDKRRGVRKEDYGYYNSFSGDSEGGGSGSGVVVITRPKGGKRSLCMDLEEVKACRDLGFELEHERMLEINNSRVSISGSTLDTSSGGNSPIANWRISSPGDDPRDVKARLKVWAQAVALALTSQHGGI